MHGLLLINKDEDYTSQDVCNVIKKIVQTKKVGHCGTLDPFAKGLMIVGINQGTKVLSYLEKESKTYQASITLGTATNTGDKTGKVIEKKEVNDYSISYLKEVLSHFLGKQMQIPPMYSAIKINGKKLYEYARKEVEVARKAREIEIYKIDFIDYQKPVLTISVTCSKGTYIRTLGEEIAKKLGTVGHVSELIRTQIGSFLLQNAQSLAELKDNVHLFSIKEMLPFKQKIVNKALKKEILNGKKITYEGNEEMILLLDEEGKELAIYEKEEPSIYRCVRGFYYENISN